MLAALPAGAHLVVSSSMPVRDLEWYARPRADVAVHANRGANGIDGVLSTAIGVALATGRAHGLPARRRRLPARQQRPARHRRPWHPTSRRWWSTTTAAASSASCPRPRRCPSEPFEQLFGTPHGVRAEHLAAAHGLASITVESADGLAPTIAATAAAGGVHVVVVRTDRAANVKLHAELHAAVAAAVGAA